MASEYVNKNGSTGYQDLVPPKFSDKEIRDADDLSMKGEKGFYTHNTHKSMQAWEDSVKVSGDGFHDSSVPKTPKTDCFYDNVSNWAR